MFSDYLYENSSTYSCKSISTLIFIFIVKDWYEVNRKLAVFKKKK